MTYYPVPFFLSTAGYGFWLDSTWRNQFDLATDHDDAWRVWHIGPTLAFEVYVPIPGDARPWPLQLIDQFTAATGRPMIRRRGASARAAASTAATWSTACPRSQAMRDLDLAITVADDAEPLLARAASRRARRRSARCRTRRRASSATARSATTIRSSPMIRPIRSPRPTQSGVDHDYFLEERAPARSSEVLDPDRRRARQRLHRRLHERADGGAWFTAQFERALDLGYSGWMYDFGEYVQPDVVARRTA